MLRTFKSVGALILFCATWAHAASVQDQFEVAKTKVLFLLSNQQYGEAVAYVEDFDFTFATSEYSQEWDYWKAVSYLRAGNLEGALTNFEALAEQGYTGQRFSFEFGLALLKQKNWIDAIEWLSRWKNSNPDETTVNYYLALSYFETAKYSTVENLLDDLLAEPPSATSISFDQVYYLSAATSAKLKKYSKAKRSIEVILTKKPVSEYADAATDLLRNVELLEDQNKKFSLSIDAIVAADSNVRIENEGNELDTRFALQANAKYQIADWLQPEYQIYFSQHQNATDFDLLTHFLAINSNYRVFSLPWSSSYRLGLNSLDGSHWLTKHTISTTATLSEFLMGGSISYNDYETDDHVLVTGSVDNPELFEVLDEPVRVYIDVFSQLNTDAELEKLGLKVGADMKHWLGDWLLNPGVALGFTSYAPENARERSFELTGNVDLTRRWQRGLSTTFKVDAQVQAAQPEAYGYDRWVASLVIGWRN